MFNSVLIYIYIYIDIFAMVSDLHGPENSIPLSPQWLLPKPGENKLGVTTGVCFCLAHLTSCFYNETLNNSVLMLCILYVYFVTCPVEYFNMKFLLTMHHKMNWVYHLPELINFYKEIIL